MVCALQGDPVCNKILLTRRSLWSHISHSYPVDQAISTSWGPGPPTLDLPLCQSWWAASGRTEVIAFFQVPLLAWCHHSHLDCHFSQTSSSARTHFVLKAVSCFSAIITAQFRLPPPSFPYTLHLLSLCSSVIPGLLMVASSTGHVALMLHMAWCHPGQKQGFLRISAPRPRWTWVSSIPRCSVHLPEPLRGAPTASSLGLCFKFFSK